MMSKHLIFFTFSHCCPIVALTSIVSEPEMYTVRGTFMGNIHFIRFLIINLKQKHDFC
jgi:hypothetical protein